MKEYCVMLIIKQLNERILCYANNKWKKQLNERILCYANN